MKKLIITLLLLSSLIGVGISAWVITSKDYHPSKETVILLAIALELNEKELDNLLESASYSLPKNNKFDLIIRFCFINKIFKLTDINELLYEYNCKLLNY